MRPFLHGVQQYQYQMPAGNQQSENCLAQGVNIQLDANLTLAQLSEHFKANNIKGMRVKMSHPLY